MAVSSAQVKRLQEQIKKLRLENARLKKQLGGGDNATQRVARKRRIIKLGDLKDAPEITEHDIAQARAQHERGAFILTPLVTDSRKRTRLLKTVTRRMKQTPLPLSAKRFTREELYERH